MPHALVILLNVVVGAIVALITYEVLTTLLVFPHSTLLWGVVAVAIFIWIAFFLDPIGRVRVR